MKKLSHNSHVGEYLHGLYDYIRERERERERERITVVLGGEIARCHGDGDRSGSGEVVVQSHGCCGVDSEVEGEDDGATVRGRWTSHHLSAPRIR